MDGHFVRQITYGSPVLKRVKQITSLPLDVHLMVDNAEEQIELFAEAGADIITVHAESKCDVPLCLEKIHGFGVRAAVALNPKTPAKRAFDFIGGCDMVLVMTVEAGYGGQSFISGMTGKVKEIREYADSNGFSELLIEVDGGINPETAVPSIKAGADILVAGTSLFKSKDMRETVLALKG